MSEISMIIPMYNAERFLRRCLDSVKNQTFQDWTAICVDDGSPDKSGKIAEEYAKKDKRFVIIHKKNGGVSDARNRGIKKVKSEYVMFLDSDDFIHPQTMEIVYNLAKHTDVDLLNFGFEKINNDKVIKNFETFTKLDYLITKNILKYITEADGVRSKYAIKRTYVCSKLYKTGFIKNILFPKNIKICEDFYWLTDCCSKLPKTLILNLPLYYYVQNESSAVNSIKRLDFVKSVCTGIEHGVCVFKNNTKRNYNLYIRNLIWPFIYSIVRTIKSIDDEKDKRIAVQYIKNIYDLGVCSRPYDLQSLKYYFRIKKLLKLYS